jgi:hypothetical protein
MNTSESINKLSAALLKAQKAITFAAKDAVNPHFRSKYADLPTVIDAIKPALNEAGVVFLQLPTPSDPGTLALTTRLMHESGEWIESTAVTPLQKNDPQGYGSAMTYLRRYSLAAAVGLYQDDDDGNAASQPAKKVQSVRITPTDGAGEGLDTNLKTAAEEAALDIVSAWQEGRELDVLASYRSIEDNDAKVYLWKLLAAESKIRAFIKANSNQQAKAA